MYTYLSSKQLLDLKSNLSNALSLVDFTIKKRSELLSMKSYSSLQDEIYNSWLDPAYYYNFKFFDKGVSIIRSKSKTSQVWVFRICCYNWVPSKSFCGHRIEMFTPDFPDTHSHSYGAFESLDEALSVFKDVVIEFFEQQFHFVFSEVMDLY